MEQDTAVRLRHQSYRFIYMYANWFSFVLTHTIKQDHYAVQTIMRISDLDLKEVLLFGVPERQCWRFILHCYHFQQ